MLSIDLDDESDLAAANLLLSGERLARYQSVTGSVRGALLLHAHSMQLAGSTLAAIGIVEIALRNATSERLTVMFDRPDWLQNPPSRLVVWRSYENQRIKDAIKSAKRSAYAALGYDGKKALDLIAFPRGVPAGIGHNERARARQAVISVPEGQVIAQLTFGFWKGLFSADYEATLWRRSLRGIFPRKTMTRAMVASNLETIYQTRNRIAHHESVAGPRVAEVKAAIAFVAHNIGSRAENPDAPLARLLKPHLALVDEHAADFDACLRSYKIS